MSGSEAPASGGHGAHALATLRLPHVRTFFGSSVLQILFTQLLGMAMQWLVTGLTPSRTVLGALGFVQGGTIALSSPAAGVLADRSSKWRLLFGGRLGLAAVALVMAALVQTGLVEIWHLFALAFVGGLIGSALQPATQAFVFDLVGRGRVENAVALNATGSGIAQVAGPALAGALIASLGIAATYFVGAAGLAVTALLLLGIPAVASPPAEGRPPFLGELREGLRYAWSDPPLRLVLLACCMALFNGAVFAMRPIFARHVLEVGSSGYGALAAAQGLGTVVTAIGLTVRPPIRQVGRWIVGSMLAYALGVLAYAFAFSFEYALGVEFLLGMSGQIWNVVTVSGLQLVVPDAYRGRILGLLFMIAQLGFLGIAAVGVLADALGDQIALGIFGVIPSLVLGLVLLFGWRVLGRLRTDRVEAR